MVGIDVAGDEGSYPLELHAPALDIAAAAGVPVTVGRLPHNMASTRNAARHRCCSEPQVHAGEWPGSIGNIKYVLSRLERGEKTIRRIGHGLRLVDDEMLLRHCAALGVGVECCLTANVGSTRAPSFASHPIKTLLASACTAAL